MLGYFILFLSVGHWVTCVGCWPSQMKFQKNLNNPFCTKQLSTNGKINELIIIDFCFKHIKFLISLNLIDILIYLWFYNDFEMTCWTLVWQIIYSLSAFDWFGSRFFWISLYQMTYSYDRFSCDHGLSIIGHVRRYI